MSTVTQPQAKRLAALGYRGTFPGMVWRDYLTSVIPEKWGWRLEWWEQGDWANEWYVAPVYVSGDGEGGALEWVEREYGWKWKRRMNGDWSAAIVGRGYYVDEADTQTASELLDAILDRLEAAQPAAKEAP